MLRGQGMGVREAALPGRREELGRLESLGPGSEGGPDCRFWIDVTVEDPVELHLGRTLARVDVPEQGQAATRP